MTPPTLAPSRFLQASDWAQLPPRLQALVQQTFGLASRQHEPRLVEYLSALTTIAAHGETTLPLTAYDIGGSGSPFPQMVQIETGLRVTVVDPADGGPDLHDFLATAPRLGSIVSCISVIEHVEDLPQFIADLATLVAPGGVLAITTDAVPGAIGDLADACHFHWMRQRIFTVDTLYRDVITPLQRAGLVPIGAIAYDPASVTLESWGFCFASVLMTKPRRRR